MNRTTFRCLGCQQPFTIRLSSDAISVLENAGDGFVPWSQRCRHCGRENQGYYRGKTAEWFLIWTPVPPVKNKRG